MWGRRSESSDNLLLIAATAFLILSAQRYFQDNAARKPHRPPANSAVARRDIFAGETAQTGYGWKGILWRTYRRSDQDRLLATAAGVVFFGLLAVFPSRRWSHPTVCSPIPRPSAPICRRWR